MTKENAFTMKENAIHDERKRIFMVKKTHFMMKDNTFHDERKRDSR